MSFLTAFSLRVRILLSFIIVSLVSLSFFISVIYENSLEFKQQQEVQFYTNLTNQFYEHLLEHSKNYNEFRRSLENDKTVYSGKKYFLLEEKENITYTSDNKN